MFEDFFQNLRNRLDDLYNDKSKFIKVGVIILIVLLFVGIRVSKAHQEKMDVDLQDISDDSTRAEEMFIDISGEVNNPGVYKFQSGERLYEIIERAGGLTSKADQDGINQAEFIEDGQKIIIPSLSEDNSVATTQTSSKNGKININNASKDELMNITGVGEVIADRIIEYRSNKRFKSIEDIMNVKGIGNATYEKMKNEISV